MSGTGTVAGSKATLSASSESLAVAGATIKLMWEPGLQGAKVGTVIKPVILATARTNPDGEYQLRDQPNSALLAAAAKNSSWVNFDLSIQTADGQEVEQALTRSWSGAKWTGRQYADSSPNATVTTTFVHSTSGKLLNGTVIPKSPQYSECYWQVVSNKKESVRIINFHNDANATGGWQYGQAADSNIDAGIEPYGDGWSVNGSVHVGNDTGDQVTGSTNNLYDAYARTNFNFGTQQKMAYYSGMKKGSICEDIGGKVGDQKTSSTGWVGSESDDHGAGSGFKDCFTSPRSKYRDQYLHNGGLTIQKTTATKVSYAVSLGFIHLGNDSGYSTDVTMTWTVHRGDGIYLCGESGEPVGGKPGIIYAEDRA